MPKKLRRDWSVYIVELTNLNPVKEVRLALKTYRLLTTTPENGLNHKNFELATSVDLLKQKIMGHMVYRGAAVIVDDTIDPKTIAIVSGRRTKLYDLYELNQIKDVAV